jgi:tetratricopeptide (TPR) repeat protein
MGEFAAAESDYVQARTIAESVEHRSTVSLAMINLASLASMRGEPERAYDFAVEALGYAREHGLADGEAGALQYLGIAELELGRFEPAREHLEAALQHRRTRDFKGVLETLVEVIPARIGAGAAEAALEGAAELLRGLDGDRLRVKFPAKALSVAAAAYEAAGETERAGALRAEAIALLREISEHFPDAAGRAGYLSLPFHRTLIDAVAVDGLETVLP